MKGKTTISLFTLVLFVIFQISCTGLALRQIKPQKVMKMTDKKKARLQILEITKKSGEKIVLSSKVDSAVFVKGGINAIILVVEILKVDIANVNENKKLSKGRFQLTTKDGKTYEYTSLRAQKNQFILTNTVYRTKFFPYSDIYSIKVKAKGVDLTEPAILVIGSGLFVLLMFFGIKSFWDQIKDESCLMISAFKETSLKSYLSALRNFRDTYLKSTKKGRALVALYYKYSPVLARLIRRDQGAKTALRLCLIPIGEFCSVVMAARNRNS